MKVKKYFKIVLKNVLCYSFLRLWNVTRNVHLFHMNDFTLGQTCHQLVCSVCSVW